MAEGTHSVEIRGLEFASTDDGRLLESDVRQHVDALMERLDALERENAEMQTRLQHLEALQRLAQETVIKADELAAEIEATARKRVDEMLQTCETDLEERRRRFDAELASQREAAQSRVAQLQTALEGTLQTLSRALQAAGAPALEMPPASTLAWSAPPSSGPAQGPTGTVDNGQPAVAASEPSAGQSPERADEGFGRFEPRASAGTSQDLPSPGPAAEAPRWGGGFAPAPITTAPPSSGGDSEITLGDREWPAASSRVSTAVEASEAPSAPSGEVSPFDRAEAIDSGDMAARDAAAPAGSDSLETGAADRAEGMATDAEPGTGTGLSRTGPDTIEIDLRPVKSFADLARVTKLLGRVAPGAQPVDLNLPQHRALFSLRGKDVQVLAAQLQEALPEAKVIARDDGIDVLLEEE